MMVEKNAAMMTSAAINFSVFRPALRPTHIPTEAGFHADRFGDDQRQERSAKSHEEPDENVRHRGGNGDAKDQITRPAPSVRATSR